MLPTKLLRAWSKVTYLHRIESMLEFWLHSMFCQPFSKIFKRRWSEISSLHLKMLVSDINCLIHVKMLENDAEIFEVKKAAKTCRQAAKFFSLSQSHPLFRLVPVPALDYTISMIVNNACESYNQPKKWAMNSHTNGRKRKRYNTFRATYNPVPLRHTFRRHLKAISSHVPHDNPSSLSDIPVSTNVNLTADQQGYMCFSREQNGNHLYEMHEDDIIFSANQSDSSMEE